MEQKHSGLGVASFAISIMAFIAMIVLIVIAGYLEVTTPGGIDKDGPLTILLGLAIIGCALLEAIALVLGVAGLFQRDCQKIFGILGSLFALLALSLTAALMVIGSMQP